MNPIPLRHVINHPRTHGGSVDVARALSLAAAPRSPEIHLFSTEHGRHLYLANGSCVFTVSEAVSNILSDALGSPADVPVMLAALGLSAAPSVTDAPPPAPAVRALSLAIAQKCNLGCTYCYAQGGSFGADPTNMSLSVAVDAIDLLFRDVSAGDRVSLSFLGGEPLINREVLRQATVYAAKRAREHHATLSFAITTNATLLTPDDGTFFEQFGFAVTVSLDGPKEMHNELRPFRGGAGSYDRIIANVGPLLARQRAMQVSARVTVTPRNLELPQTLDALIDLGFHSIGFSPMLHAPNDTDEMGSLELEVMLEQMVECGRVFETRVAEGGRYPFSNMVNAMREIHRGAHRPYPCGAGAGYFGVSATGDLAACHRFVGDTSGRMGTVASGVDRKRQTIWLTERHVHRQEPCRQCWARYMCGGGCHHEVINRGRPACDFIRGWLHYCLQAYARLLQSRPDYFTPVTEA